MTLTLSPLLILFLGELILIVLALAIYMTVSRFRYKRLYTELLAKSKNQREKEMSLSDLRQDFTQAFDTSQTMENQDETLSKSERDTQGEVIRPLDTSQETETSMEDSLQEDSTEEKGSDPGIEQLKSIVEFQKEKILHLMCYKDILDSAQNKLSHIHEGYQDLSQRFSAVAEAIGENKEFELALEMFGDNTKELEDFIDALKQENEALLEKFNQWEGQLKEMWESSQEIGASPAAINPAEQAELLEKIKEFEEKLKEKTKQLEEAQAQYEDLEKEYMTLYRQHHHNK